MQRALMNPHWRASRALVGRSAGAQAAPARWKLWAPRGALGSVNLLSLACAVLPGLTILPSSCPAHSPTSSSLRTISARHVQHLPGPPPPAPRSQPQTRAEPAQQLPLDRVISGLEFVCSRKPNAGSSPCNTPPRTLYQQRKCGELPAAFPRHTSDKTAKG